MIFSTIIADLRKGCRETIDVQADIPVQCGDDYYCNECKAKLSTLKFAQAKFDRFVEDLKKRLAKEQENWTNGDGATLISNYEGELVLWRKK